MFFAKCIYKFACRFLVFLIFLCKFDFNFFTFYVWAYLYQENQAGTGLWTLGLPYPQSIGGRTVGKLFTLLSVLILRSILYVWSVWFGFLKGAKGPWRKRHNSLQITNQPFFLQTGQCYDLPQNYNIISQNWRLPSFQKALF